MPPIYLDHAATTPMRAEVREAMEPYHHAEFGNPSSVHRWGRTARAAVEAARDRIAAAIGARRDEIVLVRGGTESDNLALIGRALADRADGRDPAVVTLATEHRAVLDTARSIEVWGGRAEVVGVDTGGRLDDDALQRALERRPSLVSVMWVNNETGILQDLAALCDAAAASGVPVHTDAVQALGKVPVRVDEIPVDLLSLSGHKLEGPKGAGALFVREGTRLEPLLRGGGQEHGLRPGTHDVAGAVGLATAVELAAAEQDRVARDLLELRTRFEQRLRAQLPELRVHGDESLRAPHISSVALPGVDPEPLLALLDLEGLAVSSGSACSSGSRRDSHVMQALYGPGTPIPATLRFSFGRTTTVADVDAAVAITTRVAEQLRVPAVESRA
jgi:cysteine desulfurase